MIDWTEEQKPNDVISYDHVTCQTPIGPGKIEWKSWKEDPSYDISIANYYVGVEDSLEEAKKTAENWLIGKANAIKDIIGDPIREDLSKAVNIASEALLSLVNHEEGWEESLEEIAVIKVKNKI